MSTLKLDTLSNKAGTASVPSETIVSGTAKAWVNFNGTGTVAIRRAFNVSSITDNGGGDYTVNFTTAMSDANYSAVATQGLGGISAYFHPTNPFQTTGIRVVASNTSGGGVDAQFICAAIFS